MTLLNVRNPGIGKFFFFHENVVATGKAGDVRALEFLGFLDGGAFEFYYDTFTLNDKLTTEAYSYQIVKNAFRKRFAAPEKLDNYIRQPSSARFGL